MRNILLFGLALCSTLYVFQAPSKKTMVANRLVSVTPNEAAAFLQLHKDWFPNVDPDTIFAPTRDQMLLIDQQFRNILIARAKDPAKPRHYRDGLQTIAEVAHFYCGQFFGYTKNGKREFACIYTAVVSLKQFENQIEMRWVEDWGEDSAGAGVRFTFIMEDESHQNFHVSGNNVGAFGTQKFSPLETPSDDLQAIRKIIDQRPEFAIDKNKPFTIELGRGSGWDGLDTFSIDETGAVSVHETTNGRRVSFSLTNKQLDSLLESVSANQLMRLCREYHDDDVSDGTQWILSIHQNNRWKTVYFNNYFPKQINDFAEELDEIISLESRSSIRWEQAENRSKLWDRLNKENAK